VTTSVVEERAGWTVDALLALRRLSALTWAGALVGLAVGGVGGRLAMMLLARLNPDATDRISDDGFAIGHLSSDTVNLLVVGLLAGVLGGGVYYVLRGLMVGPRWFRVLSISVGPAVVIGSMIVHVDGIDFTLDPALLAVALFVLIPGVYAAVLTTIGERWLAPTGWFATASPWLALAPLLLWTPILPVLGALLVAMALVGALRRTSAGETALASTGFRWTCRAALAAVFALALMDLARDVSVLV